MENVFSVNPNIKSLYVFEDGNCFEVTASGKHAAEHHAKNTGFTFQIVERDTEEKLKKTK